MTPEHFETLARLYGADLRRWPADVQASAREHTPGLEPVLREERALDAVLDTHRSPSVSTALRQRVLAAAPAARRTWRQAWEWVTGIGLAGACAAGLAFGVMVGPPPSEDAAFLTALSPYDPAALLEPELGG